MASRWLSLALVPLLAGCQASLAAPAAAPEPTPEVASAEPTPGATPEATAREPAGRCDPQGVLAGSVRMQVIPQFDPVLVQPGGEVTLLVRLSAMEQLASERSRPPLDLAVVIDRSGSMQGDKLASVKEASLDLLKKLSPRDRLTLVSYSDDVLVHLNRLQAGAPVQADARSALLGLRADGSTALGPALMRALDTLEPAQRGQDEVAHVLLLSDGIANRGEERPGVLGERAAQGFARGVSVSTLGVGLDYNEDLMTHLADQGGGRYHYVKQSDDIRRVLDDEFAGLTSTAARGLMLQFHPAPGVSVRNFYGYATASDADGPFARVGSLRHGQRRDIVVKLAGSFPPDQRASLGQFSLRFLDVDARGKSREASAPVALSTTSNRPAAEQAECSAVSVRLAEVEAAQQLDTAAKAVDAGNFDQAREVLQKAAEKIQQESKRKPDADLKDSREQIDRALKGVSASRSSEASKKEYVKATKKGAYDSGKK